MKAFNGYKETKSYSNSEREQLPKGGYVCEIKKAEVVNGKYGDQLKVSVEIAEGEYKGFFERVWRAQEKEDKVWVGTYFLAIPSDDGTEKDGWAKRRFKTFTEAVEASNAGYHWDWNEDGLRGKLFGALFSIRQKVYNGQIYDNTVCSGATSVEAIREGKYRLPKDKFLGDGQTAAAPAVDADGFINVGTDSNEPLPF